MKKQIQLFGVTVEDCVPMEALGHWDESTGEIKVRDDIKTAPGASIYIHELMHLAESLLKQEGIIKRGVGETFIQESCSVILYGLASAGLLNGITAEDIEKWIEEEQKANLSP